MFDRRRRSLNGAHHRLVAREGLDAVTPSAILPNTPPAVSPATPSASKANDPTPTVIPVTPSIQTTPVVSSSDTPTPSTPAASSSSSDSASASSSAPTSAASASSSGTRAAISSSSIPLTLGSVPTSHAIASVTPVITSNGALTFSPTLSSSVTPTSTPSSSGGTNTGAVIGAVAGSLAGIAILGFLLTWCMRRQRNRDVDDFDTQAFKRQSAVLLDDPIEPPLSHHPRPLTMVEQHNVSPALAAQAGFGGQNFYGNYGGYGQQHDMIQPVGSPPPQTYGAPMMGYNGYNDPQQSLARQPSNAAYLARQPSGAAGYAPPVAFDPNANYIDLNRSSISPYQAAQYADISRQLGTSDPSAQVPHQSSGLSDEPLPSPFDDPVVATAKVSRPPNANAPGSVSTSSAPQTQGNTTGGHPRPATVYEEGDAYSGI